VALTRLELSSCARLGIPWLVLHPGAHGGAGEAAGVRRIAAGLDAVLDHVDGAGILLETTAGMGTCVGHRFEHLRDILAATRQRDRVGVCVDTCHVLAAGYPIHTAAGWEATVRELDATVGLERVRAFHVNDSRAALGARVDRHQHLGQGHVGLEGFRCLVNDPRFAGVPMVLETPKPTDDADRVNLGVLRALAGRQRVGPRARELAARLADAAA
jgi:deoxyribonuclease-4